MPSPSASDNNTKQAEQAHHLPTPHDSFNTACQKKKVSSAQNRNAVPTVYMYNHVICCYQVWFWWVKPLDYHTSTAMYTSQVDLQTTPSPHNIHPRAPLSYQNFEEDLIRRDLSRNCGVHELEVGLVSVLRCAGDCALAVGHGAPSGVVRIFLLPQASGATAPKYRGLSCSCVC